MEWQLFITLDRRGMENFPGQSRNLMTLLLKYPGEGMGLGSDGFARKKVIVYQINILKGHEIQSRQQIFIGRT
jgi:hypothetical protein